MALPNFLSWNKATGFNAYIRAISVCFQQQGFLQGYNNVALSQTGQIAVPEKIAEETMIIDLQNNDITEIEEDDFIGLHKLYVRSPERCWVGFE